MNPPRAPDPETPAHETNDQGRLSDSQESDTIEVVFADPWLKRAVEGATLPHDVRFACAYDLHIVVDLIEKAAFLRRTETTDELWIVAGESLPTTRRISEGTASPQDFERNEYYTLGRVFAVTRKGEALSACLILMELLFRATWGFEHPEEFMAPGIVDRSTYDRLVKRLENEREENYGGNTLRH